MTQSVQRHVYNFPAIPETRFLWHTLESTDFIQHTLCHPSKVQCWGEHWKMNNGLKVKERGGSTSTWRLWPFFLLHLSSGLSGSLQCSGSWHDIPICQKEKWKFHITVLSTLLNHLATLNFTTKTTSYWSLPHATSLPTSSHWPPDFILTLPHYQVHPSHSLTKPLRKPYHPSYCASRHS